MIWCRHQGFVWVNWLFNQGPCWAAEHTVTNSILPCVSPRSCCCCWHSFFVFFEICILDQMHFIFPFSCLFSCAENILGPQTEDTELLFRENAFFEVWQLQGHLEKLIVHLVMFILESALGNKTKGTQFHNPTQNYYPKKNINIWKN